MRLALLGLLVVVVPATAQPDRYELGRRMHAFEVAWEEHATDATAKKRAASAVNRGVQSFFKLDWPGVAQAMDQARHALASAEAPSEAVRWADSLQIVPEARVFDSTVETISVTVKSFYKVDGAIPPGASLEAKVGNVKPVGQGLNQLPAKIQVNLKDAPGKPSADLPITVQIKAGRTVLATKTAFVSRVEKIKDRLAAIEKAAQDVPATPPSIEAATLVDLAKTIGEAVKGKPPETNLPMSRFVFGGEALMRTKLEPYYGIKRPGEFWLAVPTGKEITHVRIRVPDKLPMNEKVPVVVALHGMGGSENLFFDGYGNGIVPRMAEERKWIIVATRVNGVLGAGPAPDVVGVLDQLEKRYPLDRKRVYVIGHSMGAGHAGTVAQRQPGQFAAVAALGGGGRLPRADALRDVPFFVGVGKLDTLARGAKAMHESIEKAGGRSTYKEYEDIEHLTIVREAADDVFKFLDRVNGGRP